MDSYTDPCPDTTDTYSNSCPDSISQCSTSDYTTEVAAGAFVYQLLTPINEDIFGQTRLYSGPHPDRYTKYTQPTLSEPLYECRLGWYYSTSRTTSKRTGQPLKKKPSYRYERTFKGDLFLGREQDDTTAFLDDVLKLFPEENYVVFIPQELWSQYPNASSYQKSPTEGGDRGMWWMPTITGEASRLVMSAGYDNVDLQELGTVTVDLNSPVESSVKAPVTVSPCTPHNTKPTLWKRFLNWLSLEY